MDNDQYSDLTLGELTDCVPDGYTWVLGNDEDEFFCQIRGDAHSVEATAVSPEEAFREALRLLQE